MKPTIGLLNGLKLKLSLALLAAAGSVAFLLALASIAEVAQAATAGVESTSGGAAKSVAPNEIPIGEEEEKKGSAAPSQPQCSFPTCSCEGDDNECKSQHRQMVQMMLMMNPALSQNSTCQMMAMQAMNSCPKKEKKKEPGPKPKEDKKKSPEMQCFEKNVGETATMCKGMKCGAMEGQGIAEDAIAANDEVQAGLKALLDQVKKDLEKVKTGEEAAKKAAEGKKFECPTCEPLKECVEAAKRAIDGILESVKEEEGSLESAGGGEGEVGYDAALQAIETERTMVNEKFKALLEKIEKKDACTSGVEDKDGGKAAKQEFNAFATEQAGKQKELLEAVKETWCERHECKVPEGLEEVAERLAKFSDSTAEFSDEVGDISSAVGDAEQALNEAQDLLADPTGDESRNYVKGAQALAEAVEILDEANGMFDDAAAEACGDEASSEKGGEGE